MTKCEELQLDLALYPDGTIEADRRSEIDAHLPECPLCRQKLDEYSQLSAELGLFAPVSAPVGLVDAIRASAAASLSAVTTVPTFRLIDRRRRWSEIWLMPSVVGCASSVILAFALVSFILTTPLDTDSLQADSRRSAERIGNGLLDLSPDEYAHTRLAIADESPSVNPRGALVALTRSLVRGDMRDDEVTVVADVFGNGLAEIAEVVEPSQDAGAVEELQKALQSDPSYAPFVPARMDRRSETIRVVLKIQNVNVSTGNLSQ